MSIIKRIYMTSSETYQAVSLRQPATGSHNQIQHQTQQPQPSLQLKDQTSLSQLKDLKSKQAQLISIDLPNGETVSINLEALNRDKLLKALEHASHALKPKQQAELIRQASPIIQTIRSNYLA